MRFMEYGVAAIETKKSRSGKRQDAVGSANHSVCFSSPHLTGGAEPAIIEPAIIVAILYDVIIAVHATE